MAELPCEADDTLLCDNNVDCGKEKEENITMKTSGDGNVLTASIDSGVCAMSTDRDSHSQSVPQKGIVYLTSLTSDTATGNSIHFEHHSSSLPLDVISPDHCLDELYMVDCSAVSDWTLRLASMHTNLSKLKRLEMVRCTDGGQYLEARFVVNDIVLFCPNLVHLKLDYTCQPDALDFQRLVQRLRSLKTVSFTPKSTDFLFETDVATMCDPGDLSHLTLGLDLQRAVDRFEHFKLQNPDYLVLGRHVCTDVDDSSSPDEAVETDDTDDVQFPMD